MQLVSGHDFCEAGRSGVKVSSKINFVKVSRQGFCPVSNFVTHYCEVLVSSQQNTP